jgi:hypothetical protein
MDELAIYGIPQPPAEPSDDSYPPFVDEKTTQDLEKNRLELDKLRIELDIAKEGLLRNQIDNNRISGENRLRDSVQIQVWELIRIWLACVFLILIFSGIDHGVPLCQGNGDHVSCMNFKLQYESPVLVALISSPTVAIIGLAAIVLKYLFPNSEGKK